MIIKYLHFKNYFAILSIVKEDRNIMKEERNNNGRGIFYGVIGVATLIVAIIGATFAYFTATQQNTTTITGNAAAVSFGLAVEKVTDADNAGGMIPMTDVMVEAAVTATTPCQDDNGNAVCQIYKITVNNNGSASMFLDGFVDLTGGLSTTSAGTATTMRWAQVIRSGSEGSYTYAMTGDHAIAPGVSHTITWAAATANTSGVKASLPDADTSISRGSFTYSGNTYEAIANNYVRVSTNNSTLTTYTRSNTEAALVFNQYLAPTGQTGASADLFIVVWLRETGDNQTPGNEEDTNFLLLTAEIFVSLPLVE